MTYEIIFSPEAIEDIKKLKKAGNVTLLKKLYHLIEELKIHPETGTGKPEKLKHSKSGLWSRRINQVHRLVYRIDGEKISVSIIGAYGHYF
ncbi:Txe/YoeB family addiction module toxin [Belliella sp. R4-6]|uniref:Putative mRNA interferase YoeB n=1 Tax=Belliella alkalica TaxID=1730871 RepID=A0ABS9VCC0_9BACT|nr:Txe/YoeB family addiction module toxin [Belliella alkalica]MCH7414093.1 Txe/YoeB family addiction module toxin [Belliella alkalica]